MLLSVIIPTKNEALKIRDCISSFTKFQAKGVLEVIVVDNSSTDNTCAIATESGARVVTCGPERSSQRNRGGIIESKGDYIFFVDADMTVPEATMNEIICAIERPDAPDAMYVRETMTGSTLFTKIRNFERSFYDATCIDGLRVFKRKVFTQVQGFDENMYAAEDWDLDRRVMGITTRISITKQSLLHNEGDLSLFRLLRKKSYYAGNFDRYRKKWNDDEITRKQYGLKYRLFIVFTEDGKWKRAITRPHYILAIWLYKILVGFVFFVKGR